MRIAAGRAVGGRAVLEGEPLIEGSVVTVIATDDNETFEVSPEEERALQVATAQAERGDVVSWDELCRRLRLAL